MQVPRLLPGPAGNHVVNDQHMRRVDVADGIVWLGFCYGLGKNFIIVAVDESRPPLSCAARKKKRKRVEAEVLN